MTDGEMKLLELLAGYQYNLRRLAEISEKLEGKTYRITPSYSNTGGSAGGNTSHSKVEDLAEKRLKLIEEAQEYKEKIQQAEAILNCSNLSELERATLECIASRTKLSVLAKQKEIYISRVYKIRDKALQKAYKALNTPY